MTEGSGKMDNPTDSKLGIFEDSALDIDDEEGDVSPDGQAVTESENLSAPFRDASPSELIMRAKPDVESENAAFTLERTQARNHAEAALRELFDDDFDLENPPDSLNRYEKLIALRRLERAAVKNGQRRDEDVGDLPNVDHAVHVVSIMKTYGELAEHNLARVAGATRTKRQVREAAAEALSEIRQSTEEPERGSIAAVLDALADRLRPGDSS